MPGDGTVPLRWIDPQRGTEQPIVNIPTDQPSSISALRVDPHPAWHHDQRRVTFNGFVEGTRRVFVADLAALVESSMADDVSR